MFKFYANRISTKSISLEEAAAKAKGAKQAPDLDTILAEIDAKNKAVKTASTTTTVKTASAASTTAAPAETTAAAAAPSVQVKVAEMPDFIKKKIEEKEGKGDDDKAEKKPFGEKKEDKKEGAEKEACGTCASKKSVSLKMAKKLDFRAWPAEDVVKAWGQHGTMDKCVANVGKMASDAKVYCGLLQVASQEASKVVKAAAAKAQPQQKTAGTFKKVAAMTDKEKSFLKEYYTKLYGQAYVDALLENY